MGGLALVEGQSRAAQGEQDQGQTDLSTRRRRAIEPLRDRSHADPDQGQTDLSTRRKGGALGQIRLSLATYGDGFAVWKASEGAGNRHGSERIGVGSRVPRQLAGSR